MNAINRSENAMGVAQQGSTLNRDCQPVSTEPDPIDFDVHDTIAKMSLNSCGDKRPFVEVEVMVAAFNCLLDTGASVSVAVLAAPFF